MRRRTLLVAATAVATSAVAVGAGFVGADSEQDALTEVRTATQRFRRVDRAIKDGYVQFFGCVHEPLAGSMGIHFVNADLVGDPGLDVARPEALMYETRPDGTLALTGVEYVVFQEAWDAEHDAPPELFGQPLHLVAAPNRYGIPSFYALHAWAWKANPAGDHEDWNPAVLCLHPDR